MPPAVVFKTVTVRNGVKRLNQKGLKEAVIPLILEVEDCLHWHPIWNGLLACQRQYQIKRMLQNLFETGKARGNYLPRILFTIRLMQLKR